MKKILIIISILFCTTGCFNYKELNNYAIATGMAIDLNNNEYEVSFLISNSPKSNSSTSGHDYKTVIYSGKGKTIYECIKQIGTISPKELYIGHLSIVLISEDVAKKGINKIIDFLVQDPRSKKNFFVALTKTNKAKEVLSITSPLTDFPSQNLSTNIKTTSELQGSVIATDFNKLLYNIANKGVDLTLSGFKVEGNIGNESTDNNTNIPKSYIYLTPLGIFKNDKLVYWTTLDESKGINIINDNINYMYFNINCNNGYMVVEINKLKSNINVLKNKNVNIKINGKASINEITCNIDLNNQKAIKKFEKKIEDKIKTLENYAVNLSKKYNTDIFGINLKYYRNYQKTNKEYNNFKFNFDTNIKLNSTGSIKQSLERITNEKNN